MSQRNVEADAVQKRKVEYVVETKIGGDTFEVGDSKTWPKETADRHIARGWAKDPITGEQGVLKPGAVRVVPDKLTQSSRSTK